MQTINQIEPADFFESPYQDIALGADLRVGTVSMDTAVHKLIARLGSPHHIGTALCDLALHPLFEVAKLQVVDRDDHSLVPEEELEGRGSVEAAIRVMCGTKIDTGDLPGILAEDAFVAPVVYKRQSDDPVRFALAGRLTVYQMLKGGSGQDR